MYEVLYELSNDLENEEIECTHSLVPNLPCRNINLARAIKNGIKSAIKLSVKDRIHFPNSSQSIFWKIVGPATDVKTHKNVVYNISYDLKAFDKIFLAENRI